MVATAPFSDLTSSYAGARVLLTGHTGFKGAWLALWLAELGAEVHGLALEPTSGPSLYGEARVQELLASSTIGDVRDASTVDAAYARAQPTHVFHLAAQPLVRTGHETPVATFATNVLGTVHVLESARGARDLASVVVVTSDKSYDNREHGRAYVEHDPVGGSDPYSASKGAAELVAASYRQSFLAAQGVGVGTARAGNVIGGGDWARDRIVPDCIRALEAGRTITIRNPAAVRPWQHVLEPLEGYLRLGAALAADPVAHAGAWNFGPGVEDHLDVGALVDRLVAAWGSGAWTTMPEADAVHEAQLLHLDSTKAQHELAWHPRWSVDGAIERSVDWYRARHDGIDVRRTTLDQLARFRRLPTPEGAA